jgi:hypothetical protein
VRSRRSVTLDLTINLQPNARDRNDIGIFIALDGRSPAVPAASGGSASCAVFGLPFSPPPLADSDRNACGDISESGFASVHVGSVTVPCTPDAAGRLVLPAVVTWQNVGGTASSCHLPAAQWVQAGTRSKCSAGIAAQCDRVHLLLRLPVCGRSAIDPARHEPDPGGRSLDVAGPGPGRGRMRRVGKAQDLILARKGAYLQARDRRSCLQARDRHS